MYRVDPALVGQELDVADVAVVGRAIDGVALRRDLVAVAAGHPRDRPDAVARQVQEHDDVTDLHGVGLAGQQASVAAPGVSLVLRQADAPSSKVGQVLEIEVGSIAPALAQSTGLQLAPEELAPLLVGPEELIKHPGKWVAMTRSRILAIRDTPAEAYAAGREAGVGVPILYQVPDTRARFSYF